MIVKDEISFFENKQLNIKDVTVWHTYLDKWQDQIRDFQNYLSRNEKNRLQFITSKNLRVKYITSRFLLKKILAFYLNVNIEEIEFDINENGKPFLKSEIENIKFNISHSGNLLVMAMSKENETGIDVEKLVLRRDLNSVSERFFNAEEHQHILSQDHQTQAFYKMWTVKEAYAKAQGIPMLSILDSNIGPIDMNMLANERFSWNGYSFHPFQIGEYIGTLATGAKANKLSFIEI